MEKKKNVLSFEKIRASFMKDRVILFVCNYFPAHPISTNCMSVIIKSIHIKHFVPYFYSYKKTLIVLVVHIFQVKYVIWARLLLATFLSYYTKYERRLSIIYMALLTVMSGACTCIYHLNFQRHLSNVLTYYSCPHITTEPLDVMVNKAHNIF